MAIVVITDPARKASMDTKTCCLLVTQAAGLSHRVSEVSLWEQSSHHQSQTAKSRIIRNRTPGKPELKKQHTERAALFRRATATKGKETESQAQVKGSPGECVNKIHGPRFLQATKDIWGTTGEI